MGSCLKCSLRTSCKVRDRNMFMILRLHRWCTTSAMHLECLAVHVHEELDVACRIRWVQTSPIERQSPPYRQQWRGLNSMAMMGVHGSLSTCSKELASFGSVT